MWWFSVLWDVRAHRQIVELLSIISSMTMHHPQMIQHPFFNLLQLCCVPIGDLQMQSLRCDVRQLLQETYSSKACCFWGAKERLQKNIKNTNLANQNDKQNIPRNNLIGEADFVRKAWSSDKGRCGPNLLLALLILDTNLAPCPIDSQDVVRGVLDDPYEENKRSGTYKLKVKNINWYTCQFLSIYININIYIHVCNCMYIYIYLSRS